MSAAAMQRVRATLSPLLCAESVSLVVFDECPCCVDLNGLDCDNSLQLQVFGRELLEPGENV